MPRRPTEVRTRIGIRPDAMDASFVAFVPLSNWLRGFDRYAMAWSKAHIPESTWPTASYLLREDESLAPGLAKARRLVERLAIPGDRVLALRARLPVGDGGARPNDVTGTGIGWRWPSPVVPLTGVAWVEGDALVPTRHEEVTARAFRLADAHLAPWEACRPRSFSVLPVARACQASCAFCFSKASASDLDRQRDLPLDAVWRWADEARHRGAERAVITGGGEPTLLPDDRLVALVRGLADRFPSTLLITNGSRLDAARLRSLRDAGLTTLAVSRHGLDPAHDARIMGLAVDGAGVAAAARAVGLRTRAICVLQRDGVATAADVASYVSRAARDGFDDVCFKELYVSSLSENPWGASAVNAYCAEHQAPLRVVLEAMESLGFAQAGALPWGSPVFVGAVDGRAVRVAAYTEPSVGWERTNRLVRSWNVMADGECLASLEDPTSTIEDFAAFSSRRSRVLATRPAVLDLSDTNLYRALAFPPIPPSTHAEAPYRCHLAERFLDRLGLPQALKPRTSISHGVRRSLAAIFAWLAAEGKTVGIPGDVYPVYLDLARQAGVRHLCWDTRPPLDEVDALLVCEPAKPWGHALSSEAADALIRWGRWVFLDSAYATPPTEQALRLVDAGVGVLLASLSKGWLLPDHGGLCLAPAPLALHLRPHFQALPKDEGKLRIAYAALTEHPQRPDQVAARLAAAAARLDALSRARPELRIGPTRGYFAVSERSAAELLEDGVLALPASVFGSTSGGSVVTSLAFCRGTG